MGDQGGDVTIAAVLPQQGDRMPELRVRFVRPTQFGVTGIQRAAIGVRDRLGGAAHECDGMRELR